MKIDLYRNKNKDKFIFDKNKKDIKFKIVSFYFIFQTNSKFCNRWSEVVTILKKEFICKEFLLKNLQVQFIIKYAFNSQLILFLNKILENF